MENPEKEYNEMLELVKQMLGDVGNNRTNCYICTKCRHITKTIDVDSGVTPMFYECENCKHQAASVMYRNIAPLLEPTQEWYRPSLEEFEKLDRGSQYHVLNGGLLPRKIKRS